MDVEPALSKESVQTSEERRLALDTKIFEADLIYKSRLARLDLYKIYFAAIVSLGALSGFAGLVFNYWLANERARLDFELKAVEIILGAANPEAAEEKANTLNRLFPGRLPPGIATSSYTNQR